jgi:hypothetical protein
VNRGRGRGKLGIRELKITRRAILIGCGIQNSKMRELELQFEHKAAETAVPLSSRKSRRLPRPRNDYMARTGFGRSYLRKIIFHADHAFHVLDILCRRESVSNYTPTIVGVTVKSWSRWFALSSQVPFS